MRALAPGGVLSVTIWNKEEPPKSVLQALSRRWRRRRARSTATRWRIRSSSPRPISRPRPCSTSAAASPPTRSRSCASTRTAMSFDEIYSPGFPYDGSQNRPHARTAMSRSSSPRRSQRPAVRATTTAAATDPTAPADPTSRDPTGPDAARRRRAARRQGGRRRAALDRDGAARLARARQRRLARDRQRATSSTPQKLTNDAPYFAGLRENQGPAAGPLRSRPAGAAAGRVGLSADLGDARHRLPDGGGAARHPADLRLALDLLDDAGQGRSPSSISPASAPATSWSRSG